jgi:hypothetical protein
MDRIILRITLIGVFLSFYPSFLCAAELSLYSQDSGVQVGEKVVIQANIDSLTVINAITAEITFDSTKLALESVITGHSVFPLWIERPIERESGRVSFSAIAPGGFAGVQESVLELVFIAQRAGSSTIAYEAARVLAHDGKGTDVEVSTRALVLESVENQETQVRWTADADTQPPEDFSVEIVQQSDVFNGDYMLMFHTLDKNGAIAAYYVKEFRYAWQEPFVSWRLAESPYRINDQTLQSVIKVKAIDDAGNTKVSVRRPATLDQFSGLKILVLVGAGALSLYFFWRRNASKTARD